MGTKERHPNKRPPWIIGETSFNRAVRRIDVPLCLATTQWAVIWILVWRPEWDFIRAIDSGWEMSFFVLNLVHCAFDRETFAPSDCETFLQERRLGR